MTKKTLGPRTSTTLTVQGSRRYIESMRLGMALSPSCIEWTETVVSKGGLFKRAVSVFLIANTSDKPVTVRVKDTHMVRWG
jgi:hypothetical protein